MSQPPAPASASTPAPAPSGQPLLSVCLIVRNEADHMAGVLASVRPVADEIVVVDTGSTDQTPALAAALGARVLHFPWQDHFSRARNVALEAARGKWILNIDADQRLNEASIPALKKALTNKRDLGQFVTIQTHVRAAPGSAAETPTVAAGQYQAVRLIRNDKRIRYSGRVHEDVAESLLEAGSSGWPDSGIVIDDIGYVEAGERERKCARNLPLLRLACADHPDDPHPAFKLAQTVIADDPEEGRQALSEAVARLRRLPRQQWPLLAYLPHLLSMVVEDWSHQGRLIDCVQIGLEFEPALGPAIRFTLGTALARAGFWDEARRRLQAFVDAQSGQEHRWIEAEYHAHPAGACRWLAWIERMNGRLDEAAGWIERGKLLANAEQKPDLVCEAVEIEILRGNFQAASQMLDALAASVTPGSSMLPKLMHASARLAQASGDLDTAVELARVGLGQGDDLCAALLATLEVETGRADDARLQQLHDAIAGRQLDTLAVKLLIGRHLGIDWPHAVPEACAVQ